MTAATASTLNTAESLATQLMQTFSTVRPLMCSADSLEFFDPMGKKEQYTWSWFHGNYKLRAVHPEHDLALLAQYRAEFDAELPNPLCLAADDENTQTMTLALYKPHAVTPRIMGLMRFAITTHTTTRQDHQVEVTLDHCSLLPEYRGRSMGTAMAITVAEALQHQIFDTLPQAEDEEHRLEIRALSGAFSDTPLGSIFCFYLENAADVLGWDMDSTIAP